MNDIHIQIDDIIQAARQRKKIELIKMYRMVSNQGLKDSKDAIETCEGPAAYNEYKLVNLFYQASGNDPKFKIKEYEPEFCDKEYFLELIDKAIDAGKVMHCRDMLDAVLIFCRNLKEQGGLMEVAKDREEFIDKL